MLPLTVPALMRVMPNAGQDLVAEWIGPLEQAAIAWDIYRPHRLAPWLANLAHESRELRGLEEDLHYKTPARLRLIFGRHFPTDEMAATYIAKGPEAIASHVYASRLGNGDEASGDGWKYRARGPIGVTFHDNYRDGSIAVCGDADTLLLNPEFAALPDFGAALAAWYWVAHGCNKFADAGDFDGVCDCINIGHKTLKVGDSNGYADRYTYLDRANKALE